MKRRSEEQRMRAVALKTALSIQLARQQAEQEVLLAKEALQQSQERLTAALYAAGTGTFRWNVGTGAVDWDKSLEQLCGLPMGRTIHTLDEFLDTVYPADREKVSVQWERCAREGADLDLEFRALWPDGAVHWLHSKGKMVRDCHGLPQHMTGACTEITQHKATEQALRESAQRSEMALAAGQLGDWRWDAVSDEVTLAETAAGIFGLSPGVRLTWATLREHVEPKDFERARAVVAAAMVSHADFDIEYRATRPDGELRWLAARGRGLYLPDGSLQGMAGLVQDISARKSAEEKARSSAERLRATFAQVGVGVAVADLAERFREMNERFAVLLGYSPEELVEMTFAQITHPDDAAATGVQIARLTAGTIPHFSMEKRYLRKDGSIMWSATTVTLLKDAEGRPEQFIAVIDDITHRKDTEDRLHRSEQFNRSIIESSQDCIKVLTPAGELSWISGTGLRALRIASPEQILGKSWVAMWPHKEHAKLRRALATARRGQVGRFLGCFPDKDDKDNGRWWNVAITPMRSSGGTIDSLLAISRDVTERVQIERALRQETRALEVLHRTGVTIASESDVERIVRTVTEAAAGVCKAQFGAFHSNIKNRDGDALMLWSLSGPPRSAFEQVGQRFAAPLFEPIFRGEAPIRLDDVQKDRRYAGMAPGLSDGCLPVRSFLAVPVISRSSAVIGGLFLGHTEPAQFTQRMERLVVGIAAQAAIAMDNANLLEATHRAAEERKHLLVSERRARAEAERMSAMKEEFLATLSHELRTPLSSILGWTQILRRGASAAADVEAGLETIERNARVQVQLIDDLLDMSRINSGKVRLNTQPVQPYDFVEAALQTVRLSADAKGVRLETSLDPSAGPISGDPSRLQQVVCNLLTNAIKFTPRDGKVQVVLARVSSHIEISVADTGIGIDPEFLEHVFERFRQADSSTTRKYGGLGLGLSIVKHLVELHGGTVKVASPGENRGATFTIHLPIAVVHRSAAGGRADSAAARSMSADFDIPDLTGIQILVVDDEADARELLRRLLLECSANVTLAASAEEALASIATRMPTVLISDIGMPSMDGYELVRHLRQLPPQRGGTIPAIALTAFARGEDRNRALQSGFQFHVSKPVEAGELITAVARLVGRAPRPRTLN